MVMAAIFKYLLLSSIAVWEMSTSNNLAHFTFNTAKCGTPLCVHVLTSNMPCMGNIISKGIHVKICGNVTLYIHY